MPKPCGTTCGQPWGCTFGCPFQVQVGDGGGSSSIPGAAIGGNGACNAIGVDGGGAGYIGVDYGYSADRSVTVRPPQTWGIEFDWGFSFTYNGSRVASFEKHGHATVMFCKPSKAELAKELREFALAANEAATHLEMG